jgi:hypothetical protein
VKAQHSCCRGLIGIRIARRLAGRKHALTRVFAGIVIVAGLYGIARSLVL